MSTVVREGQVWESTVKSDGGRRVRISSWPTANSGASWGWIEARNVATNRLSRLMFDQKGLSRGWRLIDTCDICQGAPSRTYTPCCSSHGKVLCCRCYRLSHFVETGCECCPDGRETRARHGLPAGEASTG